MTKILGLDLGTNSIGWAIRETDNKNQIINYGVIVFKKGVGDGKSGEFSLAAERRDHRSKRRLYNAKRYRKWALLKVLIKNGMCPSLTEEELRLWSIGEWVEENGNKINKGRKYPMNEEFLLWLRMDNKYFRNKGISENGKVIRKSPYDLRCELLEGFIEDEKERKYKIGRALYHLCQRRGFKSNRKGGKSTFKPDENYEKVIKENADITPSQIWKKDLEEKNIRIRGRGKIDREEFVKEFSAICKSQQITKELSEDLYKAIYTVRKLRTQKGLVGKCTLEKSKPRIPISHPMFEEFRALQFVNNIKKRIKNSYEKFESLKIEEKKKIFAEMFFRKSKPNFKFEEITNRFSEKGKYEFNYDRKNPSVSACPFIAGLMDVFNEEWKDKFISDENRFGINWHGLRLKYNVTYGKQQGKERILKIDYAKNDESLWHLLFDFVQTQDNDEKLINFLVDVVKWDEGKAKIFADIKVVQGYGSLSSSAIRKILPYLQDGYIYSEAVSFANLKTVLGEETFNKYKDLAKSIITKVISKIDEDKEKLNIVNGLIQQHYAGTKSNKAQGLTNEIKGQAIKDIDKKFLQYFGETNWNKFTDEKKKKYKDFVTEKYLNFLDGKQLPDEKASYKPNKEEPPTDYYKLPRLDLAIKEALRKEPFNATDENLAKQYHPSDIDIYTKVTENVIDKETGEILDYKKLPQPMPPSKGWKNPMAMRTMHELRTLVNYLLSREDKEDKPRIDEETKIVVEVARDLNDANMRKSISDWNDDREKENEEYKTAIAELYDPPSDDYYNKFRLALEQIEEIEIDENKESTFKRKYDEFVKTFITGEIKKEIDEDAEVEKENTESDKKENTKISDDYLMYLILNRERFNQLLNYKIPNSQKFIKQIIKPVKDYKKRRDELKEMITKYRLWREQKFQCFYTGKQIPLSNLFSDDYQIEHTIPRSISFDSELKNLTICDTSYNNYEKNNQFPTECKNYKTSFICQTIEGEKECTPIIERVNRLIKPKVDELEARITRLKHVAESIPDWEVDRKNANIRLRHYLEFEYAYWKKKYDTFTIERKDWKDKMKNSQLVDTQLVSKYSRAYLKSLFNRVDVQKGEVTAQFRKILGLPKKTRDNHAHHAVDAMVLSLIPGSANRDAILEIWYELQECEKSVKSRPEKQDRIKVLKKQLDEELSNYNLSYIREKEKEIKSNVLINHISKDQTLADTKKKVRKRGKIVYLKDKATKQYLKDEKGNRIPMVMQGDNVRGQLFEEKFFGAIQVTEKNENNFPKKDEDGNYVIEKDTDCKPIIRYVTRIPVSKLSVETKDGIKIIKNDIVDTVLKSKLEKQLNEGKTIEQLVSYENKDKNIKHLIRHIRVYHNEQPIEVKKHSQAFQSIHQHKQSVYAMNGKNYLYLLYEGMVNEKMERDYDLINLKTFVENKELFNKPISEIPQKDVYYRNKLKGKLPCIAKLKVGQLVMMFKENKDELKEISTYDIKKRLYKIRQLETDGRIIFDYHLEARKKEDVKKEVGDGKSQIDFEKPYPKLRLTKSNFYFTIEGKDFEIKPDGEIKWLF